MIEGIQKLSREDIELRVIKVLEFFDKTTLEKPIATPLFEFAFHLQKEHNVIIDLTRDLGYSKSGGKILGLFKLKPRGIYIDKSLTDDLRLNYILAHEIGHLVLHRKLVFKQEKYESITDTEKDLITGKHVLSTGRDWIEWQANCFAAAFLMPKQLITQSVKKIQSEIGITHDLGFINLDNNAYSLRDYNLIRDELQKIYIVNFVNIEYRLKDLGILHDKRINDVKHISQFFKGI